MILADPLRSARQAVRVGDFARADTALDALSLAERASPEWQLLAAMTRWRLGDFRTSRDLAAHAREGFRVRADGDGEMRAENVAAAGAFAVGALAEAERGFHRARSLAEARGDALLAARAANNLGNVAFYRSEHQVAQGYYRLAAAGFERLGFDHGIAEARINQSIVARDTRDLATALDDAERALRVADRAGSTRVIAQAHANIGEARAGLGDPRLGRVHLHRALLLARQEGDRLALIESLRILGTLECQGGDREGAARFFAEAREAAESIEHPFMLGELLRDQAACETRCGHEESGRRLRAQAADAFARAGAEVRARALRSA